ncbi:hypothetical protein BUALT_Bualt02G0004500 [Buddleja alternifolia]|uniref:Membrane protein of ER body-like protein n=1 Tax=Buddleja alternifolia TaxID=168488 RepID=A0AAV6Y0K3_9LAMI|nr:hypothetical protein BUALT_Bualt02G0004500 [Buddleja alternifolia]
MADVIMQNREDMAEVEPDQLVQRRRRPDKTANICDDPNCDMCYESSYIRRETNGSYSKPSPDEILGESLVFDNSEGTTLQLSLSDNNLRVEDVVNSIINNQDNIENLKDQIMSGLKDPTLKQTLRQEDDIGTSGVANDQNVRIDLVDEDSDEEEIELEFERSIEKVHTHTPYCPNCNSRITKVILRRRKKERRDNSVGLFGCLSCFKIFIPSGNCLKTLGIFGSKPKLESAAISEENPGPDEHIVNIEDGSGAHTQVPGGENPSKPEIDRGPESNANACEPGSILDNHGSKLLEILKCIVYGGLMEVIASLGVVSSAAASDATTLNIIAIGFATVISGLILFSNNDGSIETSNKYQELLGRRGHFLLHSTFAILSFLIFGLVPPVVYGFTSRESDNKDYKILAVAIASFTCILILAIAKAYVKTERKFTEYIKTVVYYITMAISVSGVGYAVGDLFKMLMERVGPFEPSAPAGLSWQSY